LEPVSVVVRGARARLGDVLGDVGRHLIGAVHQAYVDDVRVAGGDVPFPGEFSRGEEGSMAQDVKVRMPVG
jgi:hypothetical protein